MSYYDYRESQRIAREDYPFYALIMAAMRQADSSNVEMLRQCWPETWNDLQARYMAPAGFLPNEWEDGTAERILTGDE
jgi:hypothetical protein